MSRLRRAGEILAPWYDQIAEKARSSAVLNVDETGWRVDGKTHWLWCFTRIDLSYYHIDPSRGSRVVLDVLGEVFPGALVCDFFAS